MMRTLRHLAVTVSLAVVTAQASATTLLFDTFDDGAVGTNTGGVGTGFSTFNGGTYTESGTTLKIEHGGGVPGSAQSNLLLNPTGLTATWVVNSRSPDNSGTADGNAILGWSKSGDPFCCGTGIYFEMRSDRTVFDFQVPGIHRYVSISRGPGTAGSLYNWNGVGPVTVTISVDATNWHLTAIGGNSGSGNTVDIDQSGTYASGGGLANVFSSAGTSLLAVTLASQNTNSAGIVFDSVLVTAVPEPCGMSMLLIGGLGLLLKQRRPMA